MSQDIVSIRRDDMEGKYLLSCVGQKLGLDEGNDTAL
jgi:hypothetical protein